MEAKLLKLPFIDEIALCFLTIYIERRISVSSDLSANLIAQNYPNNV
jgi:hypothetical protein